MFGWWLWLLRCSDVVSDMRTCTGSSRKKNVFGLMPMPQPTQSWARHHGAVKTGRNSAASGYGYRAFIYEVNMEVCKRGKPWVEGV